MNVDLFRFVVEGKLNGLSEDAIHTALLNMGRSPAEIANVFAVVKANEERAALEDAQQFTKPAEGAGPVAQTANQSVDVQTDRIVAQHSAPTPPPVKPSGNKIWLIIGIVAILIASSVVAYFLFANR
ncbi:MAG: hypothetical protein Q7S09_04355 [bacterium]|nr:hypothetical protein [bacterium]